ncbi:hypothetical protein D3C78_1701610 [compost metagenome]
MSAREISPPHVSVPINTTLKDEVFLSVASGDAAGPVDGSTTPSEFAGLFGVPSD